MSELTPVRKHVETIRFPPDHPEGAPLTVDIRHGLGTHHVVTNLGNFDVIDADTIRAYISPYRDWHGMLEVINECDVWVIG